MSFESIFPFGACVNLFFKTLCCCCCYFLFYYGKTKKGINDLNTMQLQIENSGAVISSECTSTLTKDYLDGVSVFFTSELDATADVLTENEQRVLQDWLFFYFFWGWGEFFAWERERECLGFVATNWYLHESGVWVSDNQLVLE